MHDMREEKSKSYPPTFEEVYPHYEFSELVRSAVLAAARFAWRRHPAASSEEPRVASNAPARSP